MKHDVRDLSLSFFFFCKEASKEKIKDFDYRKFSYTRSDATKPGYICEEFNVMWLCITENFAQKKSVTKFCYYYFIAPTTVSFYPEILNEMN
jgi:hypothetical protein